MFILDISKIALFAKKRVKKKKQENEILRKSKGVALLGGSAAVGTQAIRSGTPRLLGVRLEQHGTSKASARNIIKDGYLDPKYGGSLEGVTASMKLPKEFLDRSKGHVFVSGKNSTHPFWKERNILSPVSDVITRKIQVLGYRGSKAGKLTDKDIVGGQKFLAGKVAALIKPMKDKVNSLTPEKYLEAVKQQAEKGDEYYKYLYKEAKDNPEELAKTLNAEKRDFNKSIRRFEDINKRAYNDTSRVKAIRKNQKKIKQLVGSYKDEYKKWASTAKEGQDYYTVRNSKDQLLKGATQRSKFRAFIKEKAAAGDTKAKRLLALGEGLQEQLGTQKVAKYLGLGAGWTKKLVSSPFLGAAGVGKTLYIPGSDEFFNNTKRFKYDPDDPFGNPTKVGKALQSEAGGMGGNALKSKEKLRAFGNRFAASKWLLQKEGNGNIAKGAWKLIKANPGRVGAGAAILGLGGAAAYGMGKKGLELVTSNKKDIKVKASIRKGKLVKAFTRANPFYGKKIKVKKTNG